MPDRGWYILASGRESSETIDEHAVAWCENEDLAEQVSMALRHHCPSGFKIRQVLSSESPWLHYDGQLSDYRHRRVMAEAEWRCCGLEEHEIIDGIAGSLTATDKLIEKADDLKSIYINSKKTKEERDGETKALLDLYFPSNMDLIDQGTHTRDATAKSADAANEHKIDVEKEVQMWLKASEVAGLVGLKTASVTKAAREGLILGKQPRGRNTEWLIDAQSAADYWPADSSHLRERIATEKKIATNRD